MAGSSITPTVLLVCNPSEAADLRRHFDEPLPGGPIAVAVGDGGHDTLAQFSGSRPAVVVVCASLDHGDARALLDAMRAANPGGFRSVLIGDERGPVRNALDAADYGVDRFVARPIAAKALRFSVSSSMDARVTRPGRAVSASLVPRAGPNVPTIVAPVASPSAQTQPSALSSRPIHAPAAPTIPGTGRTIAPGRPQTGSPTGPDESGRFTRPPDPPPAAPEAVRTELRQRWTALADAISDHGVEVSADLLEDDLDDDPAPPAPPIPVPTPPPVLIRPRRSDPAIAAVHGDEPAWQPGTTSAPPPLTSTPLPTEGERAVIEAFSRTAIPIPAMAAPDGAPTPGGDEQSAAPVVEPFLARDLVEAPVESGAPPDVDDDSVTPPPTWLPREPTLILSEPSSGQAVAPAAPPPAALPPAAPPPAALPPAADTELPSHADDPTPIPPPAPPPLTDPGELSAPGELPAPAELAPPSGTDFARELRRKMTAMAQRLFQSAGAAPVAAVDLGVRHDHKTEIDLAALVDSPTGGGVTEIEARDDAAPPRDELPKTGDTQVRLGAESGDVVRGVSDAAAILSRAFAQAFTGRVVLKRPADVPIVREAGERARPGDSVIEKQIFFDRGKPVFASSNQEYDRMGQLLVREGKITPEQFSRCQTIVAASGRRMGEILVDLGFLKRRELLPAVRRHVEDIVYSVFAWSSGQFQMIAGDGAASERIRLSRHPAGMILEGVRRKLGTTELGRLVGPPTTVVEIGDKDKLATLIGTADLSPEERAAVAALDGNNDLAAVARSSRAELANVLQLAWGLVVLGVAHARRRDGDVEVDDGAALVGETDLAIDRDRVRARWQLVSDADYFALLGVRRDASSFEIKRAYEAARRDFAPDGFPAELRRELARELDDIVQVLDEAYHVLRDDGLRGAYLHHLRD